MSPAVIAVIPLVLIVVVLAICAWVSSDNEKPEDQVGFTIASVFFSVVGIFGIWYLGNVIWFDTWATWTVVDV